MAITLFDLTLQHDIRISSYCWRVKLMLLHKKCPFETVPYRFTDRHLIAPYGSTTVPVLLDGDRAVVDSMTILPYLDETYGDTKLISNLNELKLISYWVENAFHPLLIRIIIMDIYNRVDPADKIYFRESREKRFGKSLEALAENSDQAVAALNVALQPLRVLLKFSPFVGGEQPNAADYVIFSSFMWARCASPKVILPDQTDRVFHWHQRMLNCFDGYCLNAPAAKA